MLEPNISGFCPFKNRNRLQKLNRCGQEISLEEPKQTRTGGNYNRKQEKNYCRRKTEVEKLRTGRNSTAKIIVHSRNRSFQ
jgi:hypothetical protein